MNCISVVLTDPNTGEERYFDSLVGAARELGVDERTIRNAMGSGELCQGYKVRRGHFRNTSSNKKTNICFDCQKACGDCAWTELDENTGKPRFAPVEGWTAEKVMINLGHGGGGRRFSETYHITACPEFVQDKPRRSDCSNITLEQMELILKRWIRMGELE